MRIRAASLFTLLLPAFACHSARSATTPPDPDTSGSTDAHVHAPDTSPSPEPQDADRASALHLLASANNDFALDLYQHRASAPANEVFSPLSLSIALTMAWVGSRGETASQIKRVLHIQESQESVLQADAQLLGWIRDRTGTVTLRLADRLFADRRYTFDQRYLASTRLAFGAALEPLDFEAAADGSRRQINDWVAAQTDRRIDDLIPPGAISSQTRLVIANALYFLGAWQHPFGAQATRTEAFHPSATRIVDVPTMHQTEWLHFGQTAGVKILDLPYAGGQLAMMFVLPDAPDGSADVERHLSLAMLARFVESISPRRYVNVALPRFDIQPVNSIALRPLLVAMGMPLAFDREHADFTGIADAPQPAERLYIGDVYHKALVKVAEEGTEAAAASGAVMRRAMVERREPQPEEFNADHPFLFFLRETRSGAVLFMGRVGDPSEHSPTR